jgi:hypothetical protein
MSLTCRAQKLISVCQQVDRRQRTIQGFVSTLVLLMRRGGEQKFNASLMLVLSSEGNQKNADEVGDKSGV